MWWEGLQFEDIGTDVALLPRQLLRQFQNRVRCNPVYIFLCRLIETLWAGLNYVFNLLDSGVTNMPEN